MVRATAGALLCHRAREAPRPWTHTRWTLILKTSTTARNMRFTHHHHVARRHHLRLHPAMGDHTPNPHTTVQVTVAISSVIDPLPFDTSAPAPTAVMMRITTDPAELPHRPVAPHHPVARRHPAELLHLEGLLHRELDIPSTLVGHLRRQPGTTQLGVNKPSARQHPSRRH